MVRSDDRAGISINSNEKWWMVFSTSVERYMGYSIWTGVIMTGQQQQMKDIEHFRDGLFRRLFGIWSEWSNKLSDLIAFNNCFWSIHWGFWIHKQHQICTTTSNISFNIPSSSNSHIHQVDCLWNWGEKKLNKTIDHEIEVNVDRTYVQNLMGFFLSWLTSWTTDLYKLKHRCLASIVILFTLSFYLVSCYLCWVRSFCSRGDTQK